MLRFWDLFSPSRYLLRSLLHTSGNIFASVIKVFPWSLVHSNPLFFVFTGDIVSQFFLDTDYCILQIIIS